MNNDNRDDQDSNPEGDAEQQLGFDSDSFEPDAPGDRQDRFFSNFDDETAEIDDIEAGDFADDVDADSDFETDDARDDTIDLWGGDPDDKDPVDSGLNAAEELKALWDDEPEPEHSDSVDDNRATFELPEDEPADDSPDFDDWPHNEPEEELAPPEDPWDSAVESPTDEQQNEEEPADEYQSSPASDSEPEEPDLWDNEDTPDPGDADEWRTAAAVALSAAPNEPDNAGDDSWDTDIDDNDNDDGWDEEDWEDEEDTPARQLPWGMIAVAGVALILLGVGGFGVLQERGELQEEVTELRSQLATSANPREVSEARESARTLAESNSALQDEVARLELENRRLADTVTGLESQLKNQTNAMEELERSAGAAQQLTATSSKPSSPPSTSGSGTWFVNFGSYGNREVAEDWATRLRARYGKVIVAPAASQGRSLYRVRLIGLPSKTEAERVARELEQAHDLTKLWVGSE